jgi:hypothetical protein
VVGEVYQPKPGEIILYDAEGYRRYKVTVSAIVEVISVGGVKVMYHDNDANYHLLAYANRVEIGVSKETLDVKIGNFGWVNEDKIVLYNYDKTKVIDEIVYGFADIITKKYVINIMMDVQHTIENGYSISIDIDKVKGRHYYITVPIKMAKRI